MEVIYDRLNPYIPVCLAGIKRLAAFRIADDDSIHGKLKDSTAPGVKSRFIWSDEHCRAYEVNIDPDDGCTPVVLLIMSDTFQSRYPELTIPVIGPKAAASTEFCMWTRERYGPSHEPSKIRIDDVDPDTASDPTDQDG